MITIGVTSNNSEEKIEKLIKEIFTAKGIKTVILNSHSPSYDEIRALEYIGVEYLILPFRKNPLPKIYLDILILENVSDISEELVKCIFPDTYLLYNGDALSPHIFHHPNALSYGMSYSAQATISSIDDTSDELSLVYCLQRPVLSLYKKLHYAGEIPYTVSEHNIKITDVLAAMTCGILCDVI